MKKRFGQIVLMCTLAVMLLTVGANAASEDAAVTASSTTAPYYSDTSIPLPAHGLASLGKIRTKATTYAYASFRSITLNNNSGLPCYVSVRTSDGSQGTVCGNTIAVAGNATNRIVTYKSGYGMYGATYRPSAQTDAESTMSATISWDWRP